MLRLASNTDPAWVDRALAHIDDILLDHAHCEKKAAGAAVNFIFRYSRFPALMLPLSELAREELEHFELVVGHLRSRGRDFEGQKASPYAGRLHELIRKKEPFMMLDSLLVSTLIEARSCERMTLLAQALTDPALKKLYQGLLVSEARHHTLYLDMALSLYDEAQVRARLAEMAAQEAQIIAEAPTDPRMHNR